MEGGLDSYELAISNLVDKALYNMDRALWTDDDRFCEAFLVLLGYEHRAASQAFNGLGLWWQRVCAYQKRWIEAHERQDDPVPRNHVEARRMMIDQHARLIQDAKVFIETTQRAIRKAEDLITQNYVAMRELQEEGELSRVDARGIPKNCKSYGVGGG